MKYKKINFGPYNLHMIKTNRFKITTIELIFCNEVKKEEITITNFLASAMCYTTKKYNTKIEFAKKLEELYAALKLSETHKESEIILLSSIHISIAYIFNLIIDSMF